MGKTTPAHLRPFVKSTSGPMFMALNALRAVSIVALLLVLASNVVTIVDDSKAIKEARQLVNTTTTATAATPAATSGPVLSSTRVMVITVAPTPTSAPQVVAVAARQYTEDWNSQDWTDYSTDSTDAAEPTPTASKCNAPAVTEDEYEWVTIDENGNVTPVEDGQYDQYEYDYDTQYDGQYDNNQSDNGSDYQYDGQYNNMASNPGAVALAAKDGVAETNVTVNDYCNYIKDSTVPRQTAGAFWSILNRIFIILEAILLILAEVGYPERLFRDYIPMLGGAYGLGTLGVLQGLIASSVLSHHVSLFPQVSAWLLFMIGCVNIVAGIFLRDKAKATRALFKWERTKDDELPTTKPAYDWSADYQEKLAASKAAGRGIGQFGDSASSVYSSPSTLNNSASTHGHIIKEPTVIPGARFGGLAFGKQAELEREGNPKISRPIDLSRSG